MATPKQQLDILSPTVSLDPANDGSFVRNMENRQGSWAVRSGFGLLYRGDSTMSLTATSQGYKKHLGSRIIKTAFGHTQIVTVLSADVFTGESQEVGTYSTVYSVSVFDVEDNARVEHVLHAVTGDGGRSFHEARVLKACYEESSNRTAAKWRLSTGRPVSFQELAGNLYFANDDIGVYVYRPALVAECSAQLQGADEYAWSPARGEVSSVAPVVFSDGLNTEAFNYVTNSDLAGVSAMCEHQGSLVYASGNTIFYSDAFLPNNIKAANSDIIPVLSDITAMASNGELVYVFSRDETWVIQPALSQTGLLAGGVLTRISAEVGCLAPSAIMSVRNVPVWISGRGVHAISSNFGYETISDPIQEYWRAGVSDPFSHYATEAFNGDPGATNLALQQPETFSAPPVDPIIGYNEKFGEIYCSFDGIVWVMSGGTWLLWDFENCYSALLNPKVAASTPVNQCQVLSMLGQTYMVSIDNPDTVSGKVAGQSRTVYPYSVYELARGGGKDNSYVNEKNLIVRNSVVRLRQAGLSNASFYLELTEVNSSGEYVFLLSGIPPNIPGAQAPLRWQFELAFNTTYWEPVLDPAVPAQLDYSIPHERQGTKLDLVRADRWQHGVGPSLTGDSIMIEWGGFPVPGTRQQLNESNKNPLIYIKFKPTAANDVYPAGTNTFGWDFPAGYVAEIDDGIVPPAVVPVNYDASVYVNELSYSPQTASEGEGQPVSYLYKAPTFRLDGGEQVRTRGLYTRVTSHGEKPVLNQNYPYRLYNAAFGSDKKLYSDQVVYSSSEVVTLPKEVSIRTRIQSPAGNMVDKVFSDGAAHNPVGANYGDPAVSATGNLLIDNEQVDDIAMSTSAGGGSIGVMLFGFILDKAEAVRLYAVKMTYKAVGGARRRGR